MNLKEKLQELNLTLPEVASPVGAYLPAVRSGSYIYTSGQLPLVGGSLRFKGKVGTDVSEEEAYEAARICALNALAAAASAAGGADKILRVLKVTGYVNCYPDFTTQAKVLNGASDLLGKLFSDGHARAAVGAIALPLDTPVEVEMILEITE
ncbi:RidA family protein [Dethiobacter alkaliphilus]|uniref:Endoribonuclease L-PSP n=1 Tax=Dethiobacter alkaliphilus AHT 1 TaxID=555088 RepID=C0GDY3_DETAL|nr:RidA family protein [Dethiobacter alkaliphilus]EEG78277.1 Endoribonuclease L-PSP [Dethiobacter alkaliphilus AHT 1]